MLTLSIALFVTLFDQLTKWIVQTHMEYGESLPLIQNVFHLTYIINPGAAFGVLPHQAWFFLAVVVILFGAFLYWRKRIPAKPVYFPTAIGLLLGGALGNAIDRARLSGVVDFFDFRIWPIFNVADIAICCGVALILFYFWRHDA